MPSLLGARAVDAGDAKEFAHQFLTVDEHAESWKQRRELDATPEGACGTGGVVVKLRTRNSGLLNRERKTRVCLADPDGVVAKLPKAEGAKLRASQKCEGLELEWPAIAPKRGLKGSTTAVAARRFCVRKTTQPLTSVKPTTASSLLKTGARLAVRASAMTAKAAVCAAPALAWDAWQSFWTLGETLRKDNRWELSTPDCYAWVAES